ncbi:MAG TPA: hypothetical protein VIS76_06405 [Pseudomonadales bacterium]
MKRFKLGGHLIRDLVVLALNRRLCERSNHRIRTSNRITSTCRILIRTRVLPFFPRSGAETVTVSAVPGTTFFHRKGKSSRQYALRGFQTNATAGAENAELNCRDIGTQMISSAPTRGCDPEPARLRWDSEADETCGRSRCPF